MEKNFIISIQDLLKGRNRNAKFDAANEKRIKLVRHSGNVMPDSIIYKDYDGPVYKLYHTNYELFLKWQQEQADSRMKDVDYLIMEGTTLGRTEQQIVKETISKIGGFDIDIPLPTKSPQIKNYRHKIQYPVTQTKNSKRIIAGYYKPSSHELVNIKYCPIQPQICDDIIEYIKENAPKYNITGYTENNNSGDLKHIVIRVSSYNQENLVTLVINSENKSEKSDNDKNNRNW